MKDLTEAVREFYYYQRGTAGSFHTTLFDCIMRADLANTVLLSLGFPHEVLAVKYWRQAEDADEFFRQHGCVK